MTNLTVNLAILPPPSLLRHIAAIFYDSLILAALLMFAAALVVLPLGLGGGIDVDMIRHHVLFRLYLLLVIVGFFIGFWLRGGQTLGMRAWRLRLIRMDGQALTMQDALRRLIAALLSWLVCGFGFVWCLVDREQFTWHDRISHTRLILLPRQSYHKDN